MEGGQHFLSGATNPGEVNTRDGGVHRALEVADMPCHGRLRPAARPIRREGRPLGGVAAPVRYPRIHSVTLPR
jgi:hypothetical protein